MMKTDAQEKTVHPIAKTFYILSFLFLILSVATIVMEYKQCAPNYDDFCGYFTIVAIFIGGGITIFLLVSGFVAQKFANRNKFLDWLFIAIISIAILILIFVFIEIGSELP